LGITFSIFEIGAGISQLAINILMPIIEAIIIKKTNFIALPILTPFSSLVATLLLIQKILSL